MLSEYFSVYIGIYITKNMVQYVANFHASPRQEFEYVIMFSWR
jgi:hypothetical protein